MAFEMMVGLTVSDDEVYQQYREGMAPILKHYGGGFRYDFTVEKVLKTESHHPINRIFAIYFKDEPSKDAFFSNVEYKKLKDQYFEKSVSATTIIATYSREE